MMDTAPSLRTEVCYKADCGVPFTLPEHIYKQARRLGKGRSFYCPNGHAQVYQETEEERLKRRVESLERDLASMRESRDRYVVIEKYWRGMATRWKRKAGC